MWHATVWLFFSLSLCLSLSLSLPLLSLCYAYLIMCVCLSRPLSRSVYILLQGTLIGLYADKRYKSGKDDKKDLPLQSVEIIGGEVHMIRVYDIHRFRARCVS